MNNIEHKLQQLTATYTQNLPKKISAINDQWLDLCSNYTPLLMQDFHRSIHSLCGSAGTYGYAGLSKSARELEIYLKTKLNATLLNTRDKKTIAKYLTSLNGNLGQSTPTLSNLDFSCFEELKKNKLIYILESDSSLAQNIDENLQHIGYQVKILTNFQECFDAIHQNLPIAVIIDTEYLQQEQIQQLAKIESIKNGRTQLFCILPDAELLPRLKAIRSGCDAFFQKPIDVYYLTKIINRKCAIDNDAPYRILIVDDSETLAEYYSLILTQVGMITHAVSNPEFVLKEISAFYPDLLLMDIYMPMCTGIELATILRQEINYTKIPIIFMSTEEDRRKQLRAMDAGGDDFLTKPVDPQLLISTVNSRSKRAGILNYYMESDSLTGLLNHSTILKYLEIEIKKAQQSKYSLSFVMLDIDHFKKINDTYGHPIGDEVLKKIALLLTFQLPKGSYIGRYGGEEFAVILPNTTESEALQICNAFRTYFSEQVFTSSSTQFSCTVSAGLVELTTENNVLEQADEALYQAKLTGRNKVCAYTSRPEFKKPYDKTQPSGNYLN